MTISENWLERTELLIGKEKLEKLQKAHVLVIGLGGVGCVAAEILCRAGIGTLTIADSDLVQAGNRNRQLIALKSTEGKKKTEVLSERLRDINPDINLVLIDHFLKEDSMIELLNHDYDYVIDAIDTLSPKAYLLLNAVRFNHKTVSAMGAGAKLDPSKICVTDISETHTCPFAFDIRKRLRKLGLTTGFKAVFSTEQPLKESVIFSNLQPYKKSIAGTISYMPVMFGCYCASVVIRDLIDFKF